MNTNQSEQADHHPPFDRDDRLERVVGAELQCPRREEVVERRHQRKQHQQRAQHREQSQVEIAAVAGVHLRTLTSDSSRRRAVNSGMSKANPTNPSKDSGTTMLGGTTDVSPAPAVPSKTIEGFPPVLWVRVTDRQSDPPPGMTSASWLALVLTVSGLVVLAPEDP